MALSAGAPDDDPNGRPDLAVWFRGSWDSRVSVAEDSSGKIDGTWHWPGACPEKR